MNAPSIRRLPTKSPITGSSLPELVIQIMKGHRSGQFTIPKSDITSTWTKTLGQAAS